MNKEQIKRYVISSLVTFLTAFSIAILPAIDTITPESITTGAVFGLIFTAARAGLKAVIEFFVASQVNKE